MFSRSKFSETSSPEQGQSQNCPSAATVVYNPQQRTRAIMANDLEFEIYKKCPHGVRKCRNCYVTPLISKDGTIVSYFLEHRTRHGKMIECTLGNKNIRSRFCKKPEMADGDDFSSQCSSTSPVPLSSIYVPDPVMDRMHMDTNLVDPPRDNSHTQSTIESQMEMVQEKMRQQLPSKLVSRSARSIEGLILLLAGLQYDTSLEAIVIRCIQFLSAITEGGIVMSLKDTLMRYATNANVPNLLKGTSAKDAFLAEKAVNEPEGLSKDGFAVWETMRQGIFTKHLSYILGTVFAFSTCRIKNVNFSHPLYEKIAQHAKSDSIDGMDMIDHSIKLYNWVTTVGMACLESRSLAPLTINTTTLAKCHSKYYYWLHQFNEFKTSGDSTMEQRQLMYVEVDLIRKNLESFSLAQRDKYLTLQASSLHQAVISLFNDVKCFVTKIDRVKVAIGYHITGVPKVGKSEITPKIQETICLARGYEYRREDNAQINLMSQFQDELTNATQTITINETLPIKEHLAKSVETSYNIALALIDPVPFHPNRSNLADKAKITCQHVGVVSSGNTQQPYIHVAKTLGAWERRYKIIDMSVKKPYADEFGRIDSSKVDGSDDYHNFSVYEIVYTGGQKKYVHFTHNGKRSVDLNTTELLELIRHQCIEHFREQDKLAQKYNEPSKPGCLKCKRIGSLCKCPANTDDVDKTPIKASEISVSSRNKGEDACCGRTALGDLYKTHVFEDEVCKYCGKESFIDEDEDYDATDNRVKTHPEMGTSTLLKTVLDLAWGSVAAWINPYFKLKWIWKIDNNLQRVLHEDIVEELSHWPDEIGCKALSLIPRSWLFKKDGQPSMIGRLKLNIIQLIAAEKQIFLPLPYLFRRALFFGCLFGAMLLPLMYFVEEYLEMSPREYEEVTVVKRVIKRHGKRYLYPRFSEEVFRERDFYAKFGIYTEKYLDWNEYNMNLYPFQRRLGKLWVPWLFTEEKRILVLRLQQLTWWYYPLCMTIFVTITMFFYMWYRRWIGYSARVEELKRRCRNDPQLQSTLYDNARRHTSEYNSLIPTAVGIVGAIATGLVIWNSIRHSPEYDIERKVKSTWDYLPTFRRQTAVPVEQRNSSSDDIVNIITKHLTSVEAELDGKSRKITACYIQPGVLLIPSHFFKRSAIRDDIDPSKNEYVEYLDLFMSTNGVKHKHRAYPESMVKISGKDAFLLKVGKAPRTNSMAYLLPRETGTGHVKSNLIFLSPESKGSVENLSAKYETKIDCGGYDCGRGLSYVSHYTRAGFCGSPLVSDRRDGAILGFHISGSPYGIGTRLGYAQEITYEAYTTALKQLEARPEYLRTPEMKGIDTRRLGVNLIPNQGIHPKSKEFVLSLMDKYPSLEILGHDPSLVRYKSRVKKGILSDSIGKICEQPNRWKAPDLKRPWVQHNAALEKVAEGAREVPPQSLRWAVDDYWDDIFPKLKQHISEQPDLCRVLTLEEAINGRPDSFYMGPFRMDTAAGIPSGNKRNSGLFRELEPYPDGRKKYELTPIAMKYYEKIIAKFDNNELLGVWVRTCLKDEVVAESSDKVRIFYIMECIFALVCRQYFLPIVEFESRYPLTSECMVGVNCASKEWDTMMSYVEDLASDGQLTDLDFSKYDLKRSTDVMCASLKLDIRMGETMGYDERILKRMTCICEELRSPLINWNGTITWMYLWSSGNTMTVYGNSRENSLHQRISFHWNGIRKRGKDFYKLGKFRDNEHIVNYGDDLISGSKPEVRDICDFYAKREYFNSINMKITDAKKSDNPQATLPKEEIDFLKRKSVYHPQLGCRVGALDQESIWKMGHMTASGQEPEDLALAAIQSMLTEAFLHGESFYEDLRGKLRKCAQEVNIWTDFLDKDFDSKVIEWKEKYG